MSPTPPHRLLLASIHDVSPRFESEIDRLIDGLATVKRIFGIGER